MILLPDDAVPNGAEPALVDGGGVLRSAVSRAATQVNRPGAHYRADMTFPPMPAEKARIVVSRLVRAKREGIRVEWPLLDVKQSVPGSPVVNGAGQAGLSIAVRGLTPQYAVKEGYWLSIEDGEGQHYLHNVAGQVIADTSGGATIPLSEMLRAPFADGAKVHLGRPMIEGLVDGEIGWSLTVERLVMVSFALEEKA